MDDRFNTIAGWALGAGIVALGSALVTGELYKQHPVHEGGYPVAEAEGSGGGGAAAAKPIDWATADVAKGADVFKQCAACHTVEQGGANGTGPNLYGILGHAKAATAGFGYSDALKAKGGTWTFEEMDKWLLSPRKFVDGTKMTYAGIGDPEKRGNVIAYLNSLGSNQPLPANAPVAAAEAAPAAAADTAAAPANAAAPAEAK